MKENGIRVGIGEFVHNAIRLPDDEFEVVMRMGNNDENVDDVINAKGAKAWTKEELEAYEKL